MIRSNMRAAQSSAYVSGSAFIPLYYKKAVTAYFKLAATAFSICQEASLYIFPMGY